MSQRSRRTDATSNAFEAFRCSGVARGQLKRKPPGSHARDDAAPDPAPSQGNVHLTSDLEPASTRTAKRVRRRTQRGEGAGTSSDTPSDSRTDGSGDGDDAAPLGPVTPGAGAGGVAATATGAPERVGPSSGTRDGGAAAGPATPQPGSFARGALPTSATATTAAAATTTPGSSKRKAGARTPARTSANGDPPPRGVPEKLGDTLLRLIVVGHNPSEHAWRSGHYYSNPSNWLWRILIATGIAPPGVRGAEDDDKMPGTAGVGFLDVGCGHPGTDSSSFASEVFQAWSRAFYARLRAHMARAAASMGELPGCLPKTPPWCCISRGSRVSVRGSCKQGLPVRPLWRAPPGRLHRQAAVPGADEPGRTRTQPRQDSRVRPPVRPAPRLAAASLHRGVGVHQHIGRSAHDAGAAGGAVPPPGGAAGAGGVAAARPAGVLDDGVGGGGAGRTGGRSRIDGGGGGGRGARGREGGGGGGEGGCGCRRTGSGRSRGRG